MSHPSTSSSQPTGQYGLWILVLPHRLRLRCRLGTTTLLRCCTQGRRRTRRKYSDPMFFRLRCVCFMRQHSSQPMIAMTTTIMNSRRRLYKQKSSCSTDATPQTSQTCLWRCWPKTPTPGPTSSSCKLASPKWRTLWATSPTACLYRNSSQLSATYRNPRQGSQATNQPPRSLLKPSKSTLRTVEPLRPRRSKPTTLTRTMGNQPTMVSTNY